MVTGETFLHFPIPLIAYLEWDFFSLFLLSIETSGSIFLDTMFWMFFSSYFTTTCPIVLDGRKLFTFRSMISNMMKMTQNQHHQSKALITHFSKGTKCTQQEPESIKKFTGPDLSYTIIFLCQLFWFTLKQPIFNCLARSSKPLDLGMPFSLCLLSNQSTLIVTHSIMSDY